MKSIKFEKNNFAIYKSEAGACLAMCLKFPDFEAGRAYELGAYKKKTCIMAVLSLCFIFLGFSPLFL